MKNPEEGNESAIAEEQPSISSSSGEDSLTQFLQMFQTLEQHEQNQGWPLLSPSMVETRKCDKCFREYCSSINYRRHQHQHHRFKTLAKEMTDRRNSLGIFWDKLSVDAAMEIVSFTNVALKEVPGSTIITALSALLLKPGFSSLPQPYLKAGYDILDIVKGEPSRFPIPARHLFSVLDHASEKTFLYGSVSLKNHFLDGDVATTGLKTKNLVACSSILLEQNLMNAWYAAEDAQALRIENWAEEEKVDRTGTLESSEKKRQKRFNKEAQKENEQRDEEKEDVDETIEITSAEKVDVNETINTISKDKVDISKTIDDASEEKMNVDMSIDNASEKKADVSETMDKASEEKVDVGMTIDNASKEKVDGNETIDNASKEKVDGNETIDNASKEKVDGNETIDNASKEEADGNETIDNASEEEADGNETIDNASKEKADGNETIDNALEEKVDVNETMENASDEEADVGMAIDNASEEKADVNETMDNASEEMPSAEISSSVTCDPQIDAMPCMDQHSSTVEPSNADINPDLGSMSWFDYCQTDPEYSSYVDESPFVQVTGRRRRHKRSSTSESHGSHRTQDPPAPPVVAPSRTRVAPGSQASKPSMKPTSSNASQNSEVPKHAAASTSSGLPRVIREPKPSIATSSSNAARGSTTSKPAVAPTSMYSRLKAQGSLVPKPINIPTKSGTSWVSQAPKPAIAPYTGFDERDFPALKPVIASTSSGSVQVSQAPKPVVASTSSGSARVTQAPRPAVAPSTISVAQGSRESKPAIEPTRRGPDQVSQASQAVVPTLHGHQTPRIVLTGQKLWFPKDKPESSGYSSEARTQEVWPRDEPGKIEEHKAISSPTNSDNSEARLQKDTSQNPTQTEEQSFMIGSIAFPLNDLVRTEAYDSPNFEFNQPEASSSGTSGQRKRKIWNEMLVPGGREVVPRRNLLEHGDWESTIRILEIFQNQRWKRAVAGEHVRLVVLESEEEI